jgi:PhzF family phenazine biosynthesis protein
VSVTLVGVWRPFVQIDVFGKEPQLGNALAVVLDGTGLSDYQMQRFASWTNLAETTFVLAPTDPAADYQVRIFTPRSELPFAGHPTLGTCHAWLSQSGERPASETVVQQCAAGLVPVRRVEKQLAFAAPPLRRSGPVEESLVLHLASVLGIDRSSILDTQWVDNGPGWIGVLLESATEVLATVPGPVDLPVGVIGPHRSGSPEAFEVRAFTPNGGSTVEDPVTGSLNASLAQWLISTGRARAPYVVRQGTALGRAGRVHVHCDDQGTIWIGGSVSTCLTGNVDL